MRIHLDELTCPVCGRQHSDHIINGAPSYHDALWENEICDACDSWAWLIEADLDPGPYATDFYSDACYMRARAAV